MISKFAMDEIESMQEAGLNPSPRDIVRLNALALKIEEARGRDVRNSAALLPRVALLADGIFFRQPCVGHEIWIQSALRWVDSTDYQTMLAVNCYALSRSVDDLADANDPANAAKAVAEYAERMKEFTTDQLYTAINYVKFGSDHLSGEYVKSEQRGESTTVALDLDWDECVAVGALHEGVAVLWGLSLAEMKRMTRPQLQETIMRAYWFHGQDQHFKVSERHALGDFYKAKDEICERLKKEKENGTAS